MSFLGIVDVIGEEQERLHKKELKKRERYRETSRSMSTQMLNIDAPSIHTKEIQNEAAIAANVIDMTDVLRTIIGVEYFGKMLQTEHSMENLSFWKYIQDLFVYWLSLNKLRIEEKRKNPALYDKVSNTVSDSSPSIIPRKQSISMKSPIAQSIDIPKASNTQMTSPLTQPTGKLENPLYGDDSSNVSATNSNNTNDKKKKSKKPLRIPPNPETQKSTRVYLEMLIFVITNFIGDNAPFEVNLDSKTTKDVAQKRDE